MIYCRECGAQMHEAASQCPACGSTSVLHEEATAASGYLSFRGRIGRRVLWLHYVLPLFAASVAGAVLDWVLFEGRHQVFGPLVSLASLVPNLASGVKRCHDRNRSGWFLLINLIPLIGTIWFFIEINCLRGTIGPNRFGNDPLRFGASSLRRRPALS